MSGNKFLIRVILFIFLCLGTTVFTTLTAEETVEAAVKSPSVKESEKTLYTGYETYSIKFGYLASDATVSYKSSNKKVATVNSKGVVSPVAAGEAVIDITVKQNKKVYQLKEYITVKKPYIELTSSTVYLNEGEAYSFKANAVGTNSKVTWSVSNPEIATISEGGRVTAKLNGEVTVLVKAGKLTANCQLTVGTNRIGTFEKDITIYGKDKIWVTMEDNFGDETLSYATDKNNIIRCSWNEDWKDVRNKNQIALNIEPIAVGTDTITISSDKTKDKLIIHVTVAEQPKNLKKLSAEALYEKCGPSTVEISVTSGSASSLGSGFFIANGMIVTNYHVIEGAEKIEVSTADNKKFTVKTIIGFDKSLDLAILGTDKVYPALTLSQASVKVGQSIYTLGSPLGLTGTMSKGMVSTASRVMENGVDYIQIDASISPGNSGGPLVNEYGEVIGINTMYAEGGQNLNFAINCKELKRINTNHPMSVKDYYNAYEKLWYEAFLSNMIHEDPALSQSLSTCQQIPENVGVDGTVTAAEGSDAFYIEVDEPGWFEAVVLYDKLTDMKNTYFEVYKVEDSDWSLKGSAEEQSEDTMEYAKIYLTPGYYFILIGFDKDYTGNDVNYLFVTTQTADQ